MKETSVFTISSKNYFAFSKTLLESVREYHPEVDLHFLLADEPGDGLLLDGEGAETEILRDCVGELKNMEHLFVEYHSHITERQTLQDILSIMQGAGYRYHLKEASPRTMPFIERRRYDMDSQLDIFAYRI